MIHLTQKEKADRFDALQEAFKFTRDTYRRRLDDGYDDEIIDLVFAYNTGYTAATHQFIDILEGWIV